MAACSDIQYIPVSLFYFMLYCIFYDSNHEPYNVPQLMEMPFQFPPSFKALWRLKPACRSDILPQGNKSGLSCAWDHSEEVDTFSAQLCVVMCDGIHLDSASVHKASQRGAGSSRGVYGWGGAFYRYDLDKCLLLYVNSGHDQTILFYMQSDCGEVQIHWHLLIEDHLYSPIPQSVFVTWPKRISAH